MKRLYLSLCLLFVVAAPVFADGSGSAVVVPPFAGGSDAVVAADHAPAATPAKPTSAAVVDPAEHPLQAWDDAKARRKDGWGMLAFFVLVSLTKALAYGRDKLAGLPGIGWLARRLAVGKAAVIVAGIGAVAFAGYDVLAQGGSVNSALFTAALALGSAMRSTTKGAPEAPVKA